MLKKIAIPSAEDNKIKPNTNFLVFRSFLWKMYFFFMSEEREKKKENELIK